MLLGDTYAKGGLWDMQESMAFWVSSQTSLVVSAEEDADLLMHTRPSSKGFTGFPAIPPDEPVEGIRVVSLACAQPLNTILQPSLIEPFGAWGTSGHLRTETKSIRCTVLGVAAL